MKVGRRFGFALTSLAAAGCGTGGGTLTASWTGSDTAEVELPAKASWCPAGRYLEIRATQGDTGVAVALFPADSSLTGVSGEYPLPAESTLADSSRPAAVVAVRWADPGAVSGVRSDSGAVLVRSDAKGRLAGEFGASGFFFGSTRRRLDVKGSFGGLAVDTADAACPELLPSPSQPDSSIDSLHGNDVLPQGIRAQGGR